MRALVTVAATLAALAWPTQAWGQRATLAALDRIPASSSAGEQPADAAPPEVGFVRRSAGLAKWVSLVGTAGLAGVGFLAHQEAEDLFGELEARCAAEPDRCRSLNPDGSYTDLELEGLFQAVLDEDAAARAYLIGSQLTFAASVVFFIVDLKNDPGPENIPYDPKSFRFIVEPGAVRLAWYPF